MADIKVSKGNELSVAIGKALDEYAEEIRETAEQIIDQVAKETLARVKKDSPRENGDYAKGWKVVRDKERKTTSVRNVKYPGLTHLLEKGHVIRNQYGGWTRKSGGGSDTDPRPHIIPAQEWAAEEVERRIEEAIE